MHNDVVVAGELRFADFRRYLLFGNILHGTQFRRCQAHVAERGIGTHQYAPLSRLGRGKTEIVMLDLLYRAVDNLCPAVTTGPIAATVAKVRAGTQSGLQNALALLNFKTPATGDQLYCVQRGNPAIRQ